MSSPSFMHEGVIALVRDKPAFAASLLRGLLNVEVPQFDEARLTEATLNELVPIEYHADAVVLFVDFVETAVSIARAAVNAVLPLPEEQRLLYSILIERALSEAARKALAMEPHIEKLFSEEHRRSYDRGKTEGEAKALLMILKRRGLAITDEQQRQIVACSELAILERWLDHALSVASVEELLA